MQPFRRLLFVEPHPTGAGRALSLALDVARMQDADLTVAVLAPDPGRRALPPWGSPWEGLRWGGRIAATRARLSTLLTQREAKPRPVTLRVLEGDPTEAICREVRRGRHDMVSLVATPPRIGWPTQLAHQDRRLLRECPCPVWLLDPAQSGGPKVVLAAIALDPSGDDSLDRRILGVAGSLAARGGAALHALHAWSILGEPILADPLHGLSSRRLRDLLASTRRERRARLETLVSEELPGLACRLILRKGDPVRTLMRVASRAEADVVVVGNAARKGIEALLFGNVAERLAGRVPCSVLAVRADVTPLDPETGAGWTGSALEHAGGDGAR